MKRILTVIFIFAVSLQLAQATTYFKSWVNGVARDTLVQGDLFAWEYDVSVPGGSAHVQLYVDANHDHNVDNSDVLLIEFDQTDGQNSGDGPPPDSSSTPDGIIYTTIGSFGFAPTDYIFVVKDGNDYSMAMGYLHINPLPQVNVTVIGHLDIEGVQAPDARLANFMVEATRENFDDDIGWSALTDENGDYSINLPDSAVGKNYKISFTFESQLSQYIPQPDSYHDVVIKSGDNSSFDFTLNNPKSWVYGSVLDENGNLVAVSGWGSVVNTLNDLETEFQSVDGQYRAAAPFASDDEGNVPFHLNYWSNALIPDYMIPATWDNPEYDFMLSAGDSIEKNINVYSTNALIYVIARKDSMPLDGAYQVNANNSQYGQTYSMCNGESVIKLHVRDGDFYNVGLTNTEDGQLDMPDGYYLYPQNWQTAFAGDTVRFIFKRAEGVLSGHIHLAPDDPQGDLGQCIIEVHNTNWEKYFTAPINQDSMNFTLNVPADTFNVQFSSWNGDYLAMPVEYSQIIGNNDTTDTLDFTLNYAHAHLVVKLRNAPVDPLFNEILQIYTDGDYPYVYRVSETMRADSAFYFRICDGQWEIDPPFFGIEYVPSPSKISLNVSNDSSYYYVEFNYTLTGIEDNQPPVPESFYVKQNYPNPFNPSTTLEFGLSEREEVSVTVYNLAGQRVSTLFKGTMNSGVHRLKWDGSDMASGIYFYKIETPTKSIIKRMLLIK